jgi:hypothetical protein
MYLSEMSLFDDEDATIRTFMVTQNTNRFQQLILRHRRINFI